MYLGPLKPTEEKNMSSYRDDDNVKKMIEELQASADRIETRLEKQANPTFGSWFKKMNARYQNWIEDNSAVAFLYFCGRCLIAVGVVFFTASIGIRGCMYVNEVGNANQRETNSQMCIPICDTIGGNYLRRNGSLNDHNQVSLWSEVCICGLNNEIVGVDPRTGHVLRD